MKNALVPLLLIALAAIGVFAYFSIQDNQRQIQELTLKLNSSSKGSSLELQEKCATRAHEAFQNLKYLVRDGGEGFTNHYNEKLNKCVMLVAEGVTGIRSYQLIDSFEGRELGRFFKDEDDPDPMFCRVILPSGEARECKSVDEFNSLTKYYME